MFLHGDFALARDFRTHRGCGSARAEFYPAEGLMGMTRGVLRDAFPS